MPLFAELSSVLPNPPLGVLIFVLGGLAGAVFYLPFKNVKNWAWESYWMIYAFVGLLIVPWVLAFSTSPNVIAVLKNAPHQQLGYCFLCGTMWGLGGLTWGLMIRYLGVGLGLAIGCGLCSAAGTIIPPIIKGEFAEKILSDQAGLVSLGGVVVSIFGILLIGGAGMSKESELTEEAKKAAVAEFNFKKGMLIAIFSGLMSAGMSFGLQGGPTVEAMACPLFASSQFQEKESPDFVKGLQEASPGTLSGDLYAKFSSKAKEALKTSGKTTETLDILTIELNQIIQGENLYTTNRFATVNLSKKLAEVASTADDKKIVTMRLNRALLEEAYPKFITLQTPQIEILDQSLTTQAWRGIPVLVVVLLGGFLINAGWCLILNLKNGTTGDYCKSSSPILANLIFAGIPGVLWCSQFICFKFGEPLMDKLSYVGWSVLMASAILFSTLLGVILGEWKGVKSRTKSLLALGLLFLVLSAVISGFSGFLKESKPQESKTTAATTVASTEKTS